MVRSLCMALLLVSCIGTAAANGPGAVRKKVESTRLLKGTIDVDAQGRVAQYAIEGQESLPRPILTLMARVVPHWRFAPAQVDGKAAPMRSQMSLRLVAKKLVEDEYSVEVRGALFPRTAPSIWQSHAPPHYPFAAARGGVGGTVYAVLKVAPDGRVEEAMAEQVNLRIVTSEQQMKKWRELLAKAALVAAKDWTFKVPADERDAPFWTARVAVEFLAPGQQVTSDDAWHAYVPGPRQTIPWITDNSGLPAADALAAGGVYPVNSGLRLLTALDPG